MNLKNLSDFELNELREKTWGKLKPFIKNLIVNDEYLKLEAELSEIDWEIIDRYTNMEEIDE